MIEETRVVRSGQIWRATGWGLAAALLLLPAVAMRFTSEVNWTAGDFVVWGVMLALAGGAIELSVRGTGDLATRAGAGVAVVAGFLLVWANLAVGIIGSEDNPANLMYFGVLFVPLLGGWIARFRARGMARALVTTAIAQAAVTGIALAMGSDDPMVGAMPEIVANGVFVVLWLLSAALFWRAAGEQSRG